MTVLGSLLPENLGSEQLETLIELDGRLQPLEQPGSQTVAYRHRRGSGPQRHAAGDERYLRELFESRARIGGKIWPSVWHNSLTVKIGRPGPALPVLEGGIAREVLAQLSKVDRKPEQPEPIRQVILCGLRLGENGSRAGGRGFDQMDGAAVAERRFLGSNDD